MKIIHQNLKVRSYLVHFVLHNFAQLYYSFYQLLYNFATIFTSYCKIYDYVEQKSLSRTKLTYFDFFSSNFTMQDHILNTIRHVIKAQLFTPRFWVFQIICDILNNVQIISFEDMMKAKKEASKNLKI
jgi:hypothetical protein